MVLAPLQVESQVFGVLAAARRNVEGFSSGECEFLKMLSEHAALASHQAQLHGVLQRAYDELRATQQAADLLNISRQYLVRLLEEGRIPYTRTGKHRRLRIDDVVAYKQARDHERSESLDELARLSDELGGYDELK